MGILVKEAESAVAVNIGGVRTNFRMPDIVSIGIGGGSIVRERDGEITVGPDSVGYSIVHESIAFGGNTLTATDCLLAAGLVTIDNPKCDPTRVQSVKPEIWQNAIKVIHQEVTSVIDKIKTSSRDIPVVLVGGGAMRLTRCFR
ncbi:hydantoinase/oxoprolinase family protein [Brevibacillus sp. H7]|uniref:hydantoinase/oxoprolinase family protein n=1 Tax=Brevibacillus sp. H7 TaxID=3349138 RepID=UPI00380FDD10